MRIKRLKKQGDGKNEDSNKPTDERKDKRRDIVRKEKGARDSQD